MSEEIVTIRLSDIKKHEDGETLCYLLGLCPNVSERDIEIARWHLKLTIESTDEVRL